MNERHKSTLYTEKKCESTKHKKESESRRLRTYFQNERNLLSGSCKLDGNRNIRYFSMFTGVGGFELGLGNIRPNESPIPSRPEELHNTKNECIKWKCVGMSEWDKYSNQVLKYQFPNIKNWGDCTKINPSELPDFDMLCGGFPCQAFSIAGKRRGFEDTRGTMFFEVARILKVKRPKIVLLENVKGLLNHAKGETFRVILQTLDELGYEVQWMVLNSKFFGVPQNRERVLIIGNLRGERRSEILPFQGINNETNEQSPIKFKQYDPHNKGHHSQEYRVYETDSIRPTIRSSQSGFKIKAVLTPDRPNKRQNGRRFKEEGEPSFTLTGQDIHGVTDGIKIRRLTPTECCRLQGFPDDWNEYGIDDKGNKVKMSDTQRYKQMGNAVTTNVIKAIGETL